MPRPNTIREPTVTYNTLLPKRDLERLRARAYRRDVSVGALIREAVREMLEKPEKPEQQDGPVQADDNVWRIQLEGKYND